MNLRISVLSLIAAVAAMAPALVSADTPGRHPAYLHARSDLRAAQFLLRVHEERNVTRHLVQADHEAEASIHEIDQAAVIDHKDIDEHPHVDLNLDRQGRFRRIVELLREARADLGREEDNGRARGWRDAAYRHIDLALDNMHRASVLLHWDHEFGF